ncbi:MAG: DUF3006 domain-containing protein [Acidobacteriota bacterium]
MSKKSDDDKPEATKAKEHTLKIYIDRIEDAIATVVMSDDDSVHFNIPASYLPEGAEDGDHFQLIFKADKASAKEIQTKAEDLLKDLLGQK